MSPESRVPSPPVQSIEARPQTLAQRREQYDILPHPNCEVRLKHLLKVHSEAAVIVEPGMAKCVTVTRLFTGLSVNQVPDA